MAIMLAQQELATYDLEGATLATSAEPCAMCLGAIPWSGIKHVVYGATGDDVEAIGFDEGLKPTGWKRKLADKGIVFKGPLLREQAVEVLELYRGQQIY